MADSLLLQNHSLIESNGGNIIINNKNGLIKATLSEGNCNDIIASGTIEINTQNVIGFALGSIVVPPDGIISISSPDEVESNDMNDIDSPSTIINIIETISADTTLGMEQGYFILNICFNVSNVLEQRLFA